MERLVYVQNGKTTKGLEFQEARWKGNKEQGVGRMPGHTSLKAKTAFQGRKVPEHFKDFITMKVPSK